MTIFARIDVDPAEGTETNFSHRKSFGDSEVRESHGAHPKKVSSKAFETANPPGFIREKNISTSPKQGPFSGQNLSPFWARQCDHTVVKVGQFIETGKI